MAKKKYILVSLLKISLLILCLISFSSEQIDWIYYNYDEQYVEKDITNSEKERVIALDLTQTGSRPLDNYIKVTVTPRDNHPTPVVIFSPSPSIDNRQVISRVGDGSPAKLYLKKEQFVGGDDDLYLRVICEKDGCDYHIRFDGLLLYCRIKFSFYSMYFFPKRLLTDNS